MIYDQVPPPPPRQDEEPRFKDEGSISNSQDQRSRYVYSRQRGWSIGRFAAYLLIATFVIFIVCYTLAGSFYGDITYEEHHTSFYEGSYTETEEVPIGELFFGFLLIIAPLVYSIVGIRYSKAKYGKYLWNAKTWIPAGELLTCIIVFLIYFFMLTSGSINSQADVIGIPLVFQLIFNLIFLGVAYGIGRWREREQLLQDMIHWDKKCFKIEELAYYLGIRKSSVYEQLEKLLSKNKIAGSIDKYKGLFLSKGLRDDIVRYLREHSDENEIPLEDIYRRFKMPEGIAFNIFQNIVDGIYMPGEIDQSAGVYRLNKDGYQNNFDPRPEYSPQEPAHLDDESSRPEDKFDASDMTHADIMGKISELKEQESMIDIRGVNNALQNNDLSGAREELDVLVDNYNEYKYILKDLRKLDERKSSLAEQLADGKIDRKTYSDASESIKHKKADLEDKLNRLQREVIYEDYQKPF